MRWSPLGVLLPLVFLACGRDEDARTTTDYIVLSESSEYQQRILLDNWISFEEYGGSVPSTVSCLRENAVTIVVEPRLVPGNRIAFEFDGGPTQAEAAKSYIVYERCYKEYQDIIDLVWARQNAPSQETLDSAREFLADCLQDAGYPLPEQPSLEELRIARTRPGFRECREQAELKFNIHGFGG
jgi:hypothetical protein